MRRRSESRELRSINTHDNLRARAANLREMAASSAFERETRERLLTMAVRYESEADILHQPSGVPS